MQTDEEGLEDIPRAEQFQFSTMTVRVAARNFSDDISGLYGYYVSIVRSDGMPIETELWVGMREFTTLGVALAHGDTFKVIWHAP